MRCHSGDFLVSLTGEARVSTQPLSMPSRGMGGGVFYLASLWTVIFSSPSRLYIGLLSLWVDAVVLESQH